MKERIRPAVEYLAARLGEASTWQGIGFCLTLAGAKWAANLDWGQAAGLGGIVSALLKIIFPDPVKQ
jgi:hypothetical protein